MNITENEIKHIVKQVINEVYTNKKKLNEDSMDENALIDELGEAIEPIYKELSKLSFIYGKYASSNSGFLKSVIEDLNEASNRLEHLMFIVNH